MEYNSVQHLIDIIEHKYNALSMSEMREIQKALEIFRDSLRQDEKINSLTHGGGGSLGYNPVTGESVTIGVAQGAGGPQGNSEFPGGPKGGFVRCEGDGGFPLDRNVVKYKYVPGRDPHMCNKDCGICNPK